VCWWLGNCRVFGGLLSLSYVICNLSWNQQHGGPLGSWIFCSKFMLIPAASLVVYYLFLTSNARWQVPSLYDTRLISWRVLLFIYVQMEKLSDKQCQPVSQLKFVTDAWLQVTIICFVMFFTDFKKSSKCSCSIDSIIGSRAGDLLTLDWASPQSCQCVY